MQFVEDNPVSNAFAPVKFGTQRTGRDHALETVPRSSSALSSEFPLIEDRAEAHSAHFGSALVLRRGSYLRLSWTVLITLLLVYTGTIFLHRLCFIDFRIELALDAGPSDDDGASLVPSGEQAASSGDSPVWAAFDIFVTFVFWIDLFLNFFFSYDTEDGDEVDDLLLIARHYMKCHFVVNLIACIPEELVSFMIEGGAPDQINQGARALRLQRMSRLARLMRLSRLAKLKQQKRSGWYQWFQKQKGVRIVNLVCGLGWVVHILACGWYLCASLHDTPEDTWVYRRSVDSQGHVLGDRGPPDQWLHAMYFVLTVFTTVGFGDMFAVTVGEIVYVCITMGIGAVVHSIIISEVISVVMSNDQTNLFLTRQCELVEAFSAHTELSNRSAKHLQHWVSTNAKHWISHKYDREEMKDIITSRSMPRELLGQLPLDLFEGKLVDNRLLTVCDGLCNTPPRLPLLLALSLQKSWFSSGEIIYQVQDFPFSLFLVMSGTFSLVAQPARRGGVSVNLEPAPLRDRQQRKHNGGGLRGIVKSMPRTLGAVGKMASTKSQEEEADPSRTVYPYMLYGQGAYFGEVELVQSRPRTATARCESDWGCLLVLGKQEFKELGDKFPNFGAKWEQMAIVHDRARLRKLSGLRQGRTYRHLAASLIQGWFRELLRIGLNNCDMTRRRSLVQKRALSILVGGRSLDTSGMYDEQMRMHAEMRELARAVGNIANQVQLITQAVGCTTPI